MNETAGRVQTNVFIKHWGQKEGPNVSRLNCSFFIGFVRDVNGLTLDHHHK